MNFRKICVRFCIYVCVIRLHIMCQCYGVYFSSFGGGGGRAVSIFPTNDSNPNLTRPYIGKVEIYHRVGNSVSRLKTLWKPKLNLISGFGSEERKKPTLAWTCHCDCACIARRHSVINFEQPICGHA